MDITTLHSYTIICMIIQSSFYPQQEAVLRSHGWFSASAAVIRLLGSVTSNFATKSLASLERKIEEGGKLKRPLEMI